MEKHYEKFSYTLTFPMLVNVFQFIVCTKCTAMTQDTSSGGLKKHFDGHRFFSKAQGEIIYLLVLPSALSDGPRNYNSRL